MSKGKKPKSSSSAAEQHVTADVQQQGPSPASPDDLAPKATEAARLPKPMKTSSLLIAIVIIAAIILVPLILKKSRDASPQAGPTGVAAQPASSTTTTALPRFVDLGTTTCAPCKVMLGVMEKLKRDYPGAMVVDFVNVKEDESALDRYGIRIIPAQIFYSPAGQELFRHTGVFRAEEIVAKWAELGFPMKAAAGR